MPSLPSFMQALDRAIQVINTRFHRPLFDASDLIVENGRGAFVGTDTNSTQPP